MVIVASIVEPKTDGIDTDCPEFTFGNYFKWFTDDPTYIPTSIPAAIAIETTATTITVTYTTTDVGCDSKGQNETSFFVSFYQQ